MDIEKEFKNLFFEHNSNVGKYTVMIPNHEGFEPLLRTDNLQIAMRMCSLSCEMENFDKDENSLISKTNRITTYIILTEFENTKDIEEFDKVVVYSCIRRKEQ